MNLTQLGQDYERALRERDEARQEANNLRSQLASENQRACQLDATCGGMQKELDALKTAHCCADCQFLISVSTSWMDRCGCMESGVGDIVLTTVPWLCGHFQAKGTV